MRTESITIHKSASGVGHRNDPPDIDSDEWDYLFTTCLRHVTIHSRALEATQVAKEHEQLQAMLVGDAIASMPEFLHGPLRAHHETKPLASPEEVAAPRATHDKYVT